MRKSILAALILFAFSGLAAAQTSSAPRGWGYGFVAPGGAGSRAATLHLGAGGEALIYKGLGAGAEIGYLGPFEGLGSGFGVFSANGSYHFVNESNDKKLVPFVTAGYTLIFREGRANLFNFGGGVNYWVRKKVGLRFEFRDHVWSNASTQHFWGVRFGVAFR
ncbi:MAG TPA: hypothetical protein VJH03_03485 [Blastocatellia bacterium]|nr:hypothetical protein [Blastocatellia bacterium]